MKNITKLLTGIFLASILMFISCDNSYLEEDFRSGITSDNFFNNDEEAQLAVNGLYQILHNRYMYESRGFDLYYTWGADIVGPSRNAWSGVHNYAMAEGVDDGIATWIPLYELARNTAFSLANIEGNEKLSEAARNQAVGEILFLRALCYYHLTNIWGDVPYFRELPSPTELSTIGRTPIAQIRTDMKEDLARAISLLPASYSGSDLGRATKWAAAMLKAKFHMMDEEWAEMKTECDFIINNSPHKLLDNFADVFDQSDPANQYNLEHIFVVDFTSDAVSGTNGTTIRTTTYNPRLRDEPKNRDEKDALIARMEENNDGMTGYGWSVVLPEFAKQENWQVGDLRYDASIATHYDEFELKFPYFRKNWNLDQINSLRENHSENWIVFRMADVYLMAAEAENEMNGPGSAYTYVNRVRERAFEPDQPWGGMSQEEFRLAMYDERKFELCAEGHRRLDLIRWGILVDVVRNTVHRSWNNPAANIQPRNVLRPIPLDEILLNPALLDSDPTNNGYR